MTLGSARSETAIVKLNAQSYYTTRVSVAEAEAKRFDAQNTAYGTSAQVFKARAYFSALEKGLQDPTAVTPDQKDAGSPENRDRRERHGSAHAH